MNQPRMQPQLVNMYGCEKGPNRGGACCKSYDRSGPPRPGGGYTVKRETVQFYGRRPGASVYYIFFVGFTRIRAYLIIESGFGFTLNLVSDSVKKCIRITNPNLDSDSAKTCLQLHYTPTDLNSFDLPSESETRFSVNPNSDSIIEYALRCCFT